MASSPLPFVSVEATSVPQRTAAPSNHDDAHYAKERAAFRDAFDRHDDPRKTDHSEAPEPHAEISQNSDATAKQRGADKIAKSPSSDESSTPPTSKAVKPTASEGSVGALRAQPVIQDILPSEVKIVSTPSQTTSDAPTTLAALSAVPAAKAPNQAPLAAENTTVAGLKSASATTISAQPYIGPNGLTLPGQAQVDTGSRSAAAALSAEATNIAQQDTAAKDTALKPAALGPQANLPTQNKPALSTTSNTQTIAPHIVAADKSLTEGNNARLAQFTNARGQTGAQQAGIAQTENNLSVRQNKAEIANKKTKTELTDRTALMATTAKVIANTGLGQISGLATSKNGAGTNSLPDSTQQNYYVQRVGDSFITVAGRPVVGTAPSALAVNIEPAQQIAEAIRVRSNDRTVTVRLDPAELGRVSIDLTFDKARLVTATVAAENIDTASLLRRHLDGLQRELSAAGFDGVTIDLGEHSNEALHGGEEWNSLSTTHEQSEGVVNDLRTSALKVTANIIDVDRIDARF